MAKKTFDDYEKNIKQLHASIEEYPEVDKLKATLKHRLGKWFGLLDITIFVASNEQTPWSSEELGHKTRPMLLKSECGMQQVGDYMIFVDGHGKSLPDSFSSLLIERKGCTYESDARGGLKMVGCDLYSTLLNKTKHTRFVEETKRFKESGQFDIMVVIAECSYNEYLNFKPPCVWKRDKKGKPIQKVHNNGQHFGASKESRIAVVSSLYADHGISVLFAGSRKNAIEAYKSMIRLNVMSNYERWIDCEPDSIERPPCKYNYHDPLHEDLCIFEVTLDDLLVADSQLTPKAQDYRDELMIGVRRMADKIAEYERVYDY